MPQRLVALLLLMGVLAVGCSGGDGDDEGSATADRAAPTTAEASASMLTTAPPEYSGDPASEFCTLLRETNPETVLAGDAEDPASVEAAFGRLVDVLTRAVQVAPAEIAADVTLVAAGIDALDAALAAAGYDFQALATSGSGEEISAAVNDPAFVDAGARVSAYRSQVCGL